MSMIVILNGPNLNMLGTREPEIYGTQSLEDIRRLCEDCATSVSAKIDFRQSNHEGQLIDWVQMAGDNNAAGIIINPAGFGHSSVSLMDALIGVRLPVIEVHLSNIYRREEFRKHTYTSRASHGIISGFGGYGYLLAIYGMMDLIRKNPKPA